MKLKKIMALALAATLALSMLAGCCEDSSSPGSTGDPLANVSDTTLTTAIGAALERDGVVNSENNNTYTVNQNAQSLLQQLIGSWTDEEKAGAIEIANKSDEERYLTQPLLEKVIVDESQYISLHKVNQATQTPLRSLLFDGLEKTYVDGIVVPSSYELEDVVGAAVGYLKSFNYLGRYLSSLPSNYVTYTCYYNFSFSIAPVTDGTNTAYVVLIMIDVSYTAPAAT